MKRDHDIITLECVILRESEAAYLVETGVGKKSWVPKSQVDIERGKRMQDPAEMQIPEWMALEKGLI